MRFGVNNWVWSSPLTTETLYTLAPHVADLGFDWIEIPLEGFEDLDYREGASIIKDNSLGVSVCGASKPDRDLIHSDPEIRKSGMDYLRHAIEATHTLGGANLVGAFYSAVGRTWQMTEDERARDMDLLVQNLGQLAVYASDHGVTLCIEPLNRFETSFLNLAEQAIEVVDRVDSSACQIMLDTFHMNIEEKSSGDAIRAVGARLKHIHACESDRGSPGTGQVHWAEVAQALRDINYDGPIVIESFTSKVKSIAGAASIWRSLASSQDALAKDGLKFLKALLA